MDCTGPMVTYPPAVTNLIPPVHDGTCNKLLNHKKKLWIELITPAIASKGLNSRAGTMEVFKTETFDSDTKRYEVQLPEIEPKLRNETI